MSIRREDCRRFRTPFGALAVAALLACTMAGCPVAGAPGTGGNPAALVGVWRSQFTDPTFGAGQVELILQANGEMLQQTSYASGALVTFFGTWRVLPSEAVLRLDIERGEPDEFCGPLGCTDIIIPAGETYNYSLIDANTLQLELRVCDPTLGPCTFNYAKVQ